MIVGELRSRSPQSALLEVRGRVEMTSLRLVEFGASATFFAMAVNNRAVAAVHHVVSIRCEHSGVNALVSSGVCFRSTLIVLSK